MFQNSKLLYEGGSSYIYLYNSDEFKKYVIVKVLKNEHPTYQEVEKFNSEYELTKNLDIKGISKILKKDFVQNKHVLFMEYIDGYPLKEFFNSQKFDLNTFLVIAKDIVTTLGEIHQHSIIHKDIKPQNILVKKEGNETKIIDFGLASKFNIKTSSSDNPESLEGTLEYISPEQTRRMNREIDYRTDFYSLGITFYHILAGKLPFETEDAMEIVHYHIAKMPPPLHEIQPTIPKVVSDIVQKLLSKNAEDRYQSAFGLAHDLEYCLQKNKEGELNKLSGFRLAEKDKTGALNIPQKLYGRDEELDILLQSFERVCQGALETVFVSGKAGVGKSALINEIHKSIRAKNGLFLFGKYDQLQRDVPYSAIIQAFNVQIDFVIAQSAAKIQVRKRIILNAVGELGGVLIDIFPNLELIIGKQPPVPKLEAQEAQNRFNYIFRNFISAISRKENPIVLFIDDFQWADSASLNLFRMLLGSKQIRYLFLLGAYRTNEITGSHPFKMFIDEVVQEPIGAKDIELKPLSIEFMNLLLKETLDDAPDVEGLGELIYSKTRGNAFFTEQFLKSIYEDKHLYYNFSLRKWQWDIHKITNLNITDNVIDLLTNKIQKLPEETQIVLKLASCIGERFTLGTLSVIYEKSPEDTICYLSDALVEGILMPEKTDKKNDLLNLEYKFLHNRIRQAAYSLISKDEKKPYHLSIGRIFYKNAGDAGLEAKLFDILTHFNYGKDLITDPNEKKLLIDLNVEAGVRAFSSSAYEAAFNYYNTSIRLLENNSWQKKYHKSLIIYTNAIETAFLSGDFATTEQLILQTLEHAKNTLDKVRIYEIWILLYTAKQEIALAIRKGLEMLNMLGIKIKEKPSKIDILGLIVKAGIAMIGKKPEDLLEAPEMKSDIQSAIFQILQTLGIPIYLTGGNLVAVSALTQVILSIKHGNSQSSPVAYASYGIILSGVLGKVEKGYKFGELAVKLIEKYDAKKFYTRVNYLVSALIKPHKKHIREVLDPLIRISEIGLETGDVEYATFSFWTYVPYAYFAGKPLTDLRNKIQNFINTATELKREAIVTRLNIYLQLIVNLQNNSEQPYKIIGNIIDENEVLEQSYKINETGIIAHLSLPKLMVSYLFGEYEEAIKFSDILNENLNNFRSLYLVYVFYFYDSLSRLAIYKQSSKIEQKKILKRVAENQKKLSVSVKFAHKNSAHKYYLVQAELCRIKEENLEARDFYDKAINLAAKNRFVSEEAIACELAGKFYLTSNNNHLYQYYTDKAQALYSQWGADTKASQLLKDVQTPERSSGGSNSIHHSNSQRGTTTARSYQSLDLNTILKASQTLSGERALKSLLKRMMDIVIENAGAEKGFLILKRKDGWYIEAEGNTNSKEVKTLQSIKVDEKSENSKDLKLASSVVHYSIRRGVNVVLDDTNENEMFSKDDYIRQYSPKSILCMPVINQGVINSILYLENNVLSGVFTSNRLKILEILSSQIAISIENALYYEDLEEKIQVRTSDLRNAKNELEKTHKSITDSINYASRIQNAVLPDATVFDGYFQQHFVFYKPRNVVSGDFYWLKEVGRNLIFAAADCTGHGVPGAFVSMLGVSQLNDIVQRPHANSASSILEELRKEVKASFGHSSKREAASKDGMDIALCYLNVDTQHLQFAGANNPLYIIRNSELIEIKGDRQPIGSYLRERPFTNHEIQLQKDDTLYLFSDGFVDQIGNNNAKYMKKRFRQLLLSISDKPLNEQKELINSAYEDWKNNTQQVDDILILGIKI